MAVTRATVSGSKRVASGEGDDPDQMLVIDRGRQAEAQLDGLILGAGLLPPATFELEDCTDPHHSAW